MAPKTLRLSPLEHLVMDVLWNRGSCSADEVRRALSRKRRLKESTVRTLLRRIEEKGFARHRVEGRTYIYRPAVPAQRAAARAIRQIVDRFCGGSVEQLLAGMVGDEVVSKDELQEIAERIARSPEDES